MKFLPLSLLFVAAGVAVAAEVIPNKPYDGPIKCEGSKITSLTISGSPSIQEKTTLLLTAQMTFTLPTEKPAYDDEVRASKLAITADTDGTLLVADGFTGAWVSSGYTVADGGSVMMRAEGNLNAESKWAFKVTFSPIAAANSAVDPAAVKTVSVVSPASATTLSGFTFTGEGETSALTLGLVDMAILPPAADKAQDPALVEKYVAWLNDEAKGGALAANAKDAEKQDAFAMNVGGTPSLAIAAIDPETRKISVVGSYAAADGVQKPVDLAKINGVLTISSQEELGGEAVVQRVDVAAGAGETVTVTFPEKARFVKAAVSVNPAVTTEAALTAE